MTKKTHAKEGTLIVNESNGNITQSTTEEKVTETKPASGQSSAKQLLTLAKSFAIDGSLLPPEKQMPLQERVDRRALSQKQRQRLKQK